MWNLLPVRATAAVVRVLTYGAQKYGPNNWKRVENRHARYYAAALRHLTSWWIGELKDSDTGESHLAHALCCVLFLLEEEEEEEEAECRGENS